MDYLHTHTTSPQTHTILTGLWFILHTYMYTGMYSTYIHISYILSVTAVHLQDDMAEGTINEENKL